MIDYNSSRLALKLIHGIGDVTIKKLVAYCGSFEEIFKQKKYQLIKIPGINEKISEAIVNTTKDTSIWKRVEKELKFCEKNNIKILSFNEDNYPYRLFHCEDGPAILFYKGNINFNSGYFLSIVGTRKATSYGKQFCENLIKEFKDLQLKVTIVSGMAYGIDITAHKNAINNNLPTIGVLAHGLDTIYPKEHYKYINKILEQGALVTEFFSETNPDKPNFVKRNRIIAGLSDATIVVESKIDGGAMITADFAFNYNRDVLALPGRINDTFSEGPNYLIKKNKAALIENAKDICSILGWEIKEKPNNENMQIVFELSDEEKKILNVLKEDGDTPIDIIALKTSLPVSKVSVHLLNLEFNGVVKSLPGKIYALNIKL